MDTSKSNSFKVYLKNGTVMTFSGQGKGLYKYDLKGHETIDGIIDLFTDTTTIIKDTYMVDTVKDRDDAHTIRDQNVPPAPKGWKTS